MASPGERVFDVVRTIIYMTGFIGLWSILGAFVHQFDPALGFEIPADIRPIGFLLVFGGSVLVLNCVFWFAVVGEGTPAPFDAPREFVDDGPYRTVRNPMYVGAALIMAGAGILLRSPAVTLLTLVFFALAHLFVVKFEEPRLRERFGTSYRDYCRRVGRWLPRFLPERSAR